MVTLRIKSPTCSDSVTHSWRRGKWLVGREALSKKAKFRLRGVTHGGGEGACGKQLQLPRGYPCPQPPLSRLAILHAVQGQRLSPRGAESGTESPQTDLLVPRGRAAGAQSALVPGSPPISCSGRAWFSRGKGPAIPRGPGRSPPPRPAQGPPGPGVERRRGAGTEPLLPPGEGAAAAASARREAALAGRPRCRYRGGAGRPRSAARLACRAGCRERSASLAAWRWAGRNALWAAPAWPPSKLAVLEAAGAGGPGQGLREPPALIACRAREGEPPGSASRTTGRSAPLLPGRRGGAGWVGGSRHWGAGGSARPGPGVCRGPGQRRGGGAALRRFPCPSSGAAPRLAWLLAGLVPGKDKVSRPARGRSRERRCVTASLRLARPGLRGTAWCWARSRWASSGKCSSPTCWSTTGTKSWPSWGRRTSRRTTRSSSTPWRSLRPTWRSGSSSTPSPARCSPFSTARCAGPRWQRCRRARSPLSSASSRTCTPGSRVSAGRGCSELRLPAFLGSSGKLPKVPYSVTSYWGAMEWESLILAVPVFEAEGILSVYLAARDACKHVDGCRPTPKSKAVAIPTGLPVSRWVRVYTKAFPGQRLLQSSSWFYITSFGQKV